MAKVDWSKIEEKLKAAVAALEDVRTEVAPVDGAVELMASRAKEIIRGIQVDLAPRFPRALTAKEKKRAETGKKDGAARSDGGAAGVGGGDAGASGSGAKPEGESK